MELGIYIGVFLISAGIIIFSGARLSRYGDILGETTMLGRGLVGVLLLSFATSLPEMITTIGAVVPGNENPDLALGNVYGSNMFNMFIIFLLGFYTRKKMGIFQEPSDTAKLTSGLVIVVTAISLLGILLTNITPEDNKFDAELWNISIYSWLLLLGWFASAIFMVRFELKQNVTERQKLLELPDRKKKRNQAILGFFLYALLIVISGYASSTSANFIAEYNFNGLVLGGTFIGVLLLAVATSLPELIVSGEAIRIHQPKMALGNLVGSNLFNIVLIFFADIFYFKGSLFSNVQQNHLLSGLVSLILLGIYIAASIYRSKRKLIWWDLPAFIILVIYIIAFYLLFILRDV